MQTLPEVDPEDSNTMITAELQNNSKVSSQIIDSQISIEPADSTIIKKPSESDLFDINGESESSPQIDF